MRFSVPAACLALFSLLSMISLVAALPLDRRDVYAPHVLYPHNGTVWQMGSRHNVTWDTTSPPSQITNPNGQIYLRRGDTTILKTPLASNFSILAGHVEIALPPNLPAGNKYRIVLFGDSGNWSDEFEIAA
ncbi:hypothetical protein HWV62_15587 [Athelia sp. TMB]|nr:hypothetical protein HWV62_15587 [Athelia sp. TMB]